MRVVQVQVYLDVQLLGSIEHIRFEDGWAALAAQQRRLRRVPRPRLPVGGLVVQHLEELERDVLAGVELLQHLRAAAGAVHQVPLLPRGLAEAAPRPLQGGVELGGGHLPPLAAAAEAAVEAATEVAAAEGAAAAAEDDAEGDHQHRGDQDELGLHL